MRQYWASWVTHLLLGLACLAALHLITMVQPLHKAVQACVLAKGETGGAPHLGHEGGSRRLRPFACGKVGHVPEVSRDQIYSDRDGQCSE